MEDSFIFIPLNGFYTDSKVTKTEHYRLLYRTNLKNRNYEQTEYERLDQSDDSK